MNPSPHIIHDLALWHNSHCHPKWNKGFFTPKSSFEQSSSKGFRFRI